MLLNVISKKGLEHLTRDEKRTYVSHDDSFLSKCLQPYWNFVTVCLPEWVAPNVVTLSGFFFMCVSFFVTLYYAGNFDQHLPPFVHLVNAAGMWLYQTMDAVDGNQARRLKAGSKVGEFLDNFIDIPTMLMGVVVVCGGLSIGGWILYYTIMSLVLNHFCILWETNHTRIMAFGIGSNSVTEGQLAIIGIHLALYFYGVDTFWAKDISGYLPTFVLKALALETVEFKYAFVGFVVLLMNGLAIIASMSRVFAHKSESQTRLTALLQQLPNFTLVILSEILVRKTDILTAHPRTLVYLLALLEVMIIGAMVLKRQCEEPFSIIHWYFVPYFLIIGNLFLETPYFDTLTAVRLYVAFLAILATRLFASCVYQMCNALNVPFLRVKRRD